MKKIYGIAAVICLMFCLTASATDYTLQPTGPINSTASWKDAGNNSPADFNSAFDVWHFANRAVIPILTNSGLGSFDHNHSARIVIEGGTTLRYAGSTSWTTTIDVAAGGVLVIEKSNTTTLGNLNAASTVSFSASGTNSVFPGNYGNLVINGAATLMGDVVVNGVLTINANRVLTLNGFGLDLYGAPSLSGSGEIFGDPDADIFLNVGNGGNNGTINFAQGGNVLNFLTLNYNTNSDVINVNQDVEIQQGFLLISMGWLNLNGSDLTVDEASDVEFPAQPTDGGIVGDPQSDIFINGMVGGFFFQNVLSMDPAHNSLNSLSLRNPASLLEIGNELVIFDSLSVQDGGINTNDFVTIESTSSLKGRIGMLMDASIGGFGAISGNVTMRTFISGGGGALAGWNLLGAPGVGGTVIKDWDTYNSSGGVVGVPMTCVGCDFPPTILTPSFQSIQGWDEGADDYDMSVNASTTLDPGKGFWVYVGTNNTTTDDLSLLNTGPVVQASGFPGQIAVTASGPNSDHWNLIANPFPAPITWSKLYNYNLNSQIVNGDMHIFSPDNGYESCNASGVCTGNRTDLIPTGQGFYVSAIVGANLEFDESIKHDDNFTNLARLAKSDKSLIRLNIDGAWDSDQTVIAFDNAASLGWDNRYDARKIFVSAGYAGYGNSYSKYTTISTRDNNGNDYSINTMPLLTSNVTIPLLARVMATGSHSISLQRENYDGCVMLRDKLENKLHDLSKGPYLFDISDTTSTPRFELILCQSVTGPVTGVDEIAVKEQVQIGQDAQGAFVRTSFDKPTKATISVFNIIGQQIVKDVVIEGTHTFTTLNLNVHNQVVLIRVTTDEQTYVQKIIAH